MMLLLFCIYIFVFILCLPGSKLQNAEPNALSKSTTNSIRGLGMLLIFFAHAIENNINTITFFYYVSAILGVSSCFFVSGYGLYAGYESKTLYFHGFFLKRFSRILVPYVLIYTVSLIADLIQGASVSLNSVIREILSLRMNGLLLWYLKIQLLLYIFFYIAFGLIRKKSAQICFLFILTFIYIVIMYMLGFEYYWYSTCLFFAIGVVVSKYRNEVLCIIQNRKCTLAAAVVFAATYLFIFFVGRAGLDFLVDGIYMLSFIILVIGVLSVRPGSYFLQLMGTFSMEIYLVHLMLLKNHVWGLFNPERGLTYWLLLLATLALSIPLHLISTKIIGLFRRNRVPENVV